MSRGKKELIEFKIVGGYMISIGVDYEVTYIQTGIKRELGLFDCERKKVNFTDCCC